MKFRYVKSSFQHFSWITTITSCFPSSDIAFPIHSPPSSLVIIVTFLKQKSYHVTSLLKTLLWFLHDKIQISLHGLQSLSWPGQHWSLTTSIWISFNVVPYTLCSGHIDYFQGLTVCFSPLHNSVAVLLGDYYTLATFRI